MRLQPQIVYPDVEPTPSEPLDGYESSFRVLPVICELLMQQLAAGKIAKPNIFSDLMPGDFVGRPYDDEALDREVYAFKNEWDRVLFGEGKVTFETPQLRDILASEIEYAKSSGYPLLDSSKSGVSADELFKAAQVLLRVYEGRGFRGVGRLGQAGGLTTADLQAASAAAASVSNQNLPSGPAPTNDSFAAVMQQMSPYMELAFKILAELMAGTISVVSQVANGASLASALATSSAGAAATLNSMAATGGQAFNVFGVDLLLPTAMDMQMFMVTVQVLMESILAIMKCAANWTAMRQQLRALIKASSQIRESFDEIARQITEATQETVVKTDLAMAQFRAVMGEMIARIQNGEHIIGFLNCNADGSMWVTFGVDSRFLRDTGTQETTPAAAPGAMTGTQKAVLLAAGAAILFKMAGAR